MLINLTSPGGQINNINSYTRIKEWLIGSKINMFTFIYMY
jgi:energy-converting hydrogenase Eha subunit F